MQELVLSATQSNWRLFIIRSSDPRFDKVKLRVHARDKGQCVYCGFKSLTANLVTNYDGNYSNNKLSNLVTTCPLCAQCGFLESVGVGDYGGGSIIYLPNISQVDLNGLCHSLFLAMALCTKSETNSKAIYRDLRLRSQTVDKILGKGMSKPDSLGRILIDDSTRSDPILDQSSLDGLRLLPSYMRFMPDITYWVREGISRYEIAGGKK